MRTNIDIDDKLMKETLRASGARTKRDAVLTAMRSYVQLWRQEKIRELRGMGGWEGDLEQSRLGRFAHKEW